MPRILACSSLVASARLRTGPQGIPCSASLFRAWSVVTVFAQLAMTSRSSASCRLRMELLAKRGSSMSEGTEMAAASPAIIGSAGTTSTICPSLVSNASTGYVSGCRLPTSRIGSSV